MIAVVFTFGCVMGAVVLLALLVFAEVMGWVKVRYVAGVRTAPSAPMPTMHRGCVNCGKVMQAVTGAPYVLCERCAGSVLWYQTEEGKKHSASQKERDPRKRCVDCHKRLEELAPGNRLVGSDGVAICEFCLELRRY
jgi:hypothetical protein